MTIWTSIVCLDIIALYQNQDQVDPVIYYQPVAGPATMTEPKIGPHPNGHGVHQNRVPKYHTESIPKDFFKSLSQFI
jgi:hypothetical protein